MLLPYWTHGRIQSMEGLYYESAATTPYHFMAVAPLSGIRATRRTRSAGSTTGRSTTSTSACATCGSLGGPVLHGVFDQEAKDARGREPRAPSSIATTCPTSTARRARGLEHLRGARPRHSSRRCRYEPVVVDAARGDAVRVLRRGRPAPTTDPELGDVGVHGRRVVERTRRTLDRPLAAGGPAGLAAGRPPARRRHGAARRLPPVTVTDVHQTDDDISFHVSRTGVPVVVRTSYFPNWEAHGARRAVAADPEPHGRGAHLARR